MSIALTVIGETSLGHKTPLLINFYQDSVIPAMQALPTRVVCAVVAAPLLIFYIAVGALEYYIEDIV